MLVIRDTSERQRIVKSVHYGAGDSDEAKCLSGHLSRDKTQAKILERFFWKGISFDVSAFVEICSTCQKTNPCYEKEKGVLHSVNEPDWS